MSEGKKDDTGKPDWHALPLRLIKPMVAVAEAGVVKYGRFNILKKFDKHEERFFSAMMRHAEECQIDPLAIDEEDGCYHLAKVAFNALAELNQALMANEQAITDRSEWD